MSSSKYKFLLFFLLPISGCTVYSFTGASLVNGEKTISIQQFYNDALLGPSNMSQVFTEKIKDYFQQNTNLTLIPNDGDLQFDGYISSYTVTPVAPRASGSGDQPQVSTTSRVRITVKATYVNIKNEQFDFDNSFSFFVDFDSENTDLTSNEDRFVEEIFDQIIIDIFNASVANW